MIVGDLFEWKGIYAGFLSFVYTCICILIVVEDSVIKKGSWYPINWFNPATFYVCPMPGRGFRTSYVMGFFCVQ